MLLCYVIVVIVYCGMWYIFARVIFSTAKKPDHISPLLHKLHWLPIEQRIIYKTAVITFEVLHNRQPANLADLVTPQRSTRDLRSISQNLLVPFRTKLTTTPFLLIFCLFYSPHMELSSIS